MFMISVVIPLYNKEQSITRTLDSVLAQTYTDYEIVIVNDGSSDHSAQVVEEFIKSRKNNHQSPIRLISQPNGGVSSARNRGILESQGEYVAFLDADDLWASTYLEELINLIADFPGAGIYGMGSNAILKSEQFAEDEKNGFRGWVSNPWDKNFGFWTGSSSSSRANLIAVGLFDERMAYGEDLDMWYRLLLFGGGVYCSKCLAFYVQDAENRAMNKVIPFEKHLPFYIEKYTEFRKNNLEFRKYFDEQCLYRLFPYTCIRKYRKDLKRVLSQIDFSLQKPSMRLRFMFPRLYKLYMKKHHRI